MQTFQEVRWANVSSEVPSEETLPYFMSCLQSFKPLFPALHQGSSRAASQVQSWPARCRPRVWAWDDTLARSFMPVSRLPGRVLGEESKGRASQFVLGK